MDYSKCDEDAILSDLAAKFDRIRLEKRLKDEDIERIGGVSRQLISSFRNGKRNISLRSFIRLLKGINEIERLQTLFPDADSYSPRMETPKEPRKRVRDKHEPSKPFQWGDEK